ncbi:MAG: peroxiredoxin family protein, partial [Youngiibacter sp.]|nr:peroxiredoxin family protein [Youngiibacter sp.]
MDKKVKALLSVLLLVLVIGGAYAGYKVLSKGNAPQPTQSTQSTSGSETEEKTPAPDFRVFDGSGKEVRVSDLKGEIVVHKFWA